MVAELRAAFTSWDAVFRFRVLGWKLRGRHFFRFRGHSVVFAELKGAICILGRHFHLVVSSEGGIPIGYFHI